MRRQILPAILMMVVLTVGCGVLYPLVVTGIGQVAFQLEGRRVAGEGRRQGRRLVS